MGVNDEHLELDPETRAALDNPEATPRSEEPEAKETPAADPASTATPEPPAKPEAAPAATGADVRALSEQISETLTEMRDMLAERGEDVPDKATAAGPDPLDKLLDHPDEDVRLLAQQLKEMKAEKSQLERVVAGQLEERRERIAAERTTALEAEEKMLSEKYGFSEEEIANLYKDWNTKAEREPGKYLKMNLSTFASESIGLDALLERRAKGSSPAPAPAKPVNGPGKTQPPVAKVVTQTVTGGGAPRVTREPTTAATNLDAAGERMAQRLARQ